MGISNKKFDTISEKFVKEALAGNIQRCTPKIISRLKSEEGSGKICHFI